MLTKWSSLNSKEYFLGFHGEDCTYNQILSVSHQPSVCYHNLSIYIILSFHPVVRYRCNSKNPFILRNVLKEGFFSNELRNMAVLSVIGKRIYSS